MSSPRLSLSALTLLLEVVAVFIVLSLTGTLQIFQRISKPVLLPMARFASGTATKVENLFKSQDDLNALNKENQALRERVTALEIQQADLNRQLLEMKILREEQDFLNRRNLKGAPVRVIGRSQTSAQQILLDAGRQQGIKVGSPALAANGVLIGLIYEVSEETSSLKLPSSDGINVAAKVDNETKSPGIINGERGVGIRLNLIPQNEVLKENQTVLTSDLDPNVPSGLIIGTISKIQQTPGALFQSASVIPAIDYDKLNVLMILTNQ